MEIKLAVPRESIPYFAQWTGAWAMHEPALLQLRESVSRLNLSLHLAAGDANRQQALDRVDDDMCTVQEGIAIINLSGPMMKHASSFSSSCSTAVARQKVREYAADPNILGIMLKIDSPGGTVAGTKELADAIKQASAVKPTLAYCSDLCASAAYWVASQCQSIEANDTALVGSIGTYCVVQDSSAAAAEAGVKVHVIRAGSFKGVGTPGTEITEEHLADSQLLINGINTFFVDAVSNGRQMAMDSVSSLADGRIHLAATAQSVGLIDRVSSFEDCFERFVSQFSVSPAGPGNSWEGTNMAQEPNAVQPATLAELEKEFPKSSADWKLACLRGGMPIDAARRSYCDMLTAELESSAKQLEQAKAQASKPGLKPLKSIRAEEYKPKDDEEPEAEDEDEMESEDEEEDEVVASWNRAVAREMKHTNGDRAKAISNVNRKQPNLRKALVTVANAKRR